jgi:hypothetical protein
MESYNPDFPYLLNDLDYPVPDPAWHYAEVWARLMQIQKQTNNLATFLQMEAAEHESPAVDQTIREHLRQVAAQTNAIMGLLG